MSERMKLSLLYDLPLLLVASDILDSDNMACLVSMLCTFAQNILYRNSYTRGTMDIF